jgi:hypothetical protein
MLTVNRNIRPVVRGSVVWAMAWAQPLGGPERRLQPGLRQQHREFFPTQSADDIGVTHLALTQPGNHLQHFIAYIMTMGVIDGLEQIGVHHQQRRLQPIPPRPEQFSLTQLHEMPAVVQAGQAIHRGQMPQLLQNSLAFGDVGQYAFDGGDGMARIGTGVGADLDPDGFAVPAP